MPLSHTHASVLRTAAISAVVSIAAALGVTGIYTKDTGTGQSATRDIYCWKSGSGNGICINELGGLRSSGSLVLDGVTISSGSLISVAGQGLNIAGGAVSLNSSFSGTSLKILGTMSGKSLVTYGEPRIPKVVQIPLCDGATACATGSGVMFSMAGMGLRGSYLLSGAYLNAAYAGTTNTMNVQLRNISDAVDVFSTTISLDSTERTSRTAATPYVIGNKIFSANDDIMAVVTAVQTTPAKGVTLLLDLIPQ